MNSSAPIIIVSAKACAVLQRLYATPATKTSYKGHWVKTLYPTGTEISDHYGHRYRERRCEMQFHLTLTPSISEFTNLQIYSLVYCWYT